MHSRRIKSIATLVAFLFAVVLSTFWPGAARAIFTWDYTVAGTNLTGSGSFSFANASGNDTGGVLDFSWSGQVFGHAFSCSGAGNACLTSAFWSIDPNTFELLDVDLLSHTLPTDDGFNADIRIFFAAEEFNDFRARSFCSPVCGDMPTVTIGTEASVELTAVQAPEPATLALFALGLAGLGWARRRGAV